MHNFVSKWKYCTPTGDATEEHWFCLGEKKMREKSLKFPESSSGNS